MPDLLQGAEKRKADLAFWMTVTSSVEGTAPLKIAAGTWPVTIGTDIEVSVFEDIIEAKLKDKVTNGFNAKEISLTGYLRFKSTDSADPPVYRLTNELKIGVATVKKDCCPKTGGDSGTEESTDDSTARNESRNTQPSKRQSGRL